MLRLFSAFLFLLLPSLAWSAQVLGLRSHVAAEHTQLIVELSERINYKAFGLDSPDRLVVDLRNTRNSLVMPVINGSPTVSQVRAGNRNGGADLRLVIDLNRATETSVALLEPIGTFNYRLVLQVNHDQVAAASVHNQTPQVIKRVPLPTRKFIVAIDAGHGGHDAGAVGKHGTREKDVNLAIAKRLAAQVNRIQGLQARLIRSDDRFLELRERMNIAREHQADLFVSVHADAFTDRRVRGSSVYALSDHAASDEARRWLAQKHRAADLLGGVSLHDKDETLASVLMDLQQSATIDSSIILAGYVIDSMGALGKVHKRAPQQKGFMVLRSPDIPSILVETAFISNPTDEKRLKTRSHQDRVAAALVEGIENYLAAYAPADTEYAQLNRRVASGY